MRQIGDRVLAHWSGGVCWYPGVICGVEEFRYVVQFDDGDRDFVFPLAIKTLELPPGTVVQARWGRDLTYLPSLTVLEQRGQAVRVRTPDGTEEWTSVSLVRLDLGDQAAPATPLEATNGASVPRRRTRPKRKGTGPEAEQAGPAGAEE